MKTSTLCGLLLGILLVSSPAQTIFVVRHAEKAPVASASAAPDDPQLSAAGRARAESLGRLLKDAKIRAIFATEFKRTQQTAAPLARILKLSTTVVPAKETPALIEKLKTRSSNALVVGHSNTVPEIIKGLGGMTEVRIADSDYDNLFVIQPGPGARLLRLHY